MLSRVQRGIQHALLRDMRNIELGNNEVASCGLVFETDGTFTGLTFSQSRSFKTLKGAEKWLASKGYAVGGARL